MTASDSSQWQLWVRGTLSSLTEAAIQGVCRLNGSKLRDTGHSTEPLPPAAIAELLSVGS